MPNVLVKDPDEVIDYTVDWEAEGWLATSETISASSWTVTPVDASSPLTVDSDNNDTTTATAFLSAGNVGQSYRVTNEITTNQSRTGHKTVVVRVEER